jgi:hypothetical protein
MATKITRDVIESYLNCKYKGHLKLAGKSGTHSDYETMTTAARRAAREEAVARLMARFPDARRGVAVTAAMLKEGAPLLADATLEDDRLSLRLDALRRADGAATLGGHHYHPQPAAEDERAGDSQAERQGHLHRPAAFLYLPRPPEKQAGEEQGFSPLVRVASCGVRRCLSACRSSEGGVPGVEK